MNIVFMGTPDFAVPVLHALHDAGHSVITAVTQPDKPKGRKRIPVAPPVKVAAQGLGIPVQQFTRIREDEAAAQLEALRADIIVTAAFGQILSERNLAAARLGVVNAHASLLPQYRGPAPANWGIINGETVFGVTSMHTDAGIDTGDIILKRETPIQDGETAGELLGRLSDIAAELMVETLEQLENGTAPRIKQDETQASYFPMLKKQDGLLDFSRPAQELRNLALGVDPWPGAYAQAGDEAIRLYKPSVVDGSGKPGELLDDKQFVIACGEGALAFVDVQAPGKKRMAAGDFLRGRQNFRGFEA